jgi:hypothetical protein
MDSDGEKETDADRYRKHSYVLKNQTANLIFVDGMGKILQPG